MGDSKDAPEPPDYGPLAKVSEKSAQYAYRISKEQLAWAKQKYNLDSKVVKQVVGKQLRAMDAQYGDSRRDRARYEKYFVPLEKGMAEDAELARQDMLRRRQEYAPIEDAMRREALDYGSAEFREREAGRAMADVAAQMEQARKSALSNLESFGINPSSVRYAGLDRAAGLQRAASAAAAGNMARDRVDATKRGLQDRALGYRTQQEGVGRGAVGDAMNVGRGLPSQAMAGASAAYQGGNSAVGNTLQNTQVGAGTMGTGAQWQGLGNQAVGMWGDILSQDYANRLNQWNANQQASSGIGSAFGLFGGMIAPHLEGGGSVPGMDEFSVPEQASPSGGAIPDDVDARLEVGEFVMPRDVVEWMGERAFHQIIEKAKKEMGEIPQRSGAIPEMLPVENSGAAPAFQSSGAIPER